MNTTAQPSHLQKIQARLAESRFLSFSLLIHAIVIALAGTYIITHQDPPEDMMSGAVDTMDIPMSTMVEQEMERPPEIEVAQEPPRDLPPQPPTEGTPPVTFGKPGPVHIPTPTFKSETAGCWFPPLTTRINKVPSTLSLRSGKDNTGRILTGKPGKPGSTTASEDAVLKGLNWLRDHQAADGAWGERNKGAMTGLALLCFLGHGELTDSENYGLAVNKGLQWMIDQGTAHQGRLSMTDGGWGSGNAGVYEHAIATYALGEYYTMSKDERVTELLRTAVGHIVQGQGPDGGWMYHFDKTQGDTSVSGWQVQALKAAHLTGLNLPGVDTALDRSMANFERVRGPAGGYGYRGPEDRYSLTGVGVLCQLFWMEKRVADLKHAVNFISDKSNVE